MAGRYIALTDLAGDTFEWMAAFNVGAGSNVGALVPIDASDPTAGTTIYSVYAQTIQARETVSEIATLAAAVCPFPSMAITTVDGRAGVLALTSQNAYVIESCGVDDAGAPLVRLWFATAVPDPMPPFYGTVAALVAIFGAAAYINLTKLDGDPIAWWANNNVSMIVAVDANDPAAGTALYPLYGESLIVRETPAEIDALAQVVSAYPTQTVTTVDGRSAIIATTQAGAFLLAPCGEVVEGGAPLSVIGPATNCHVSVPIRKTVAELFAVFTSVPQVYITLTDLAGDTFEWLAAFSLGAGSNVGMLVPIDANDPTAGTMVYPTYGDAFAARETPAEIDALAQALTPYATENMITSDGRTAIVLAEPSLTVFSLEPAGATSDGAPLSVIRFAMGCPPQSPPIRKTVAELLAIFGP